MTTTTVTPTMTTRAALRTLAVLCGLLTIRATRATLRAAVRAYRATRRALTVAHIWLTTPHAFARDNDDPEGIILTGWQYIGAQALCAAVIILLSIDWDALI